MDKKEEVQRKTSRDKGPAPPPPPLQVQQSTPGASEKEKGPAPPPPPPPPVPLPILPTPPSSPVTPPPTPPAPVLPQLPLQKLEPEKIDEVAKEQPEKQEKERRKDAVEDSTDTALGRMPTNLRNLFENRIAKEKMESERSFEKHLERRASAEKASGEPVVVNTGTARTASVEDGLNLVTVSNTHGEKVKANTSTITIISDMPDPSNSLATNISQVNIKFYSRFKNGIKSLTENIYMKYIILFHNLKLWQNHGRCKFYHRDKKMQKFLLLSKCWMEYYR